MNKSKFFREKKKSAHEILQLAAKELKKLVF